MRFTLDDKHDEDASLNIRAEPGDEYLAISIKNPPSENSGNIMVEISIDDLNSVLLAIRYNRD